jgi:hypothetical protein
MRDAGAAAMAMSLSAGETDTAYQRARGQQNHYKSFHMPSFSALLRLHPKHRVRRARFQL